MIAYLSRGPSGVLQTESARAMLSNVFTQRKSFSYPAEVSEKTQESPVGLKLESEKKKK